MPIDEVILNRLSANEPILIELDLSSQDLIDFDICQLIMAITTNKTLTSLDLSHNEIGDEGAKALASNRTISSLNLRSNQIGDKGAIALASNQTLTSLDISRNEIGVESAKALARNQTLTSLDLSYQPIGDEGAKALADNHTFTLLDARQTMIGEEGAVTLACNQTLTSLDLGWNQIGEKGAKALKNNRILTSLFVDGNSLGSMWEEKLNLAIARNQQQLIQRRDQFIQAIIILANDRVNSYSQSLIAQLPLEIFLYIINLINFRGGSSIGKNSQQIINCVKFILDNIEMFNQKLKNQQGVKFFEKCINGRSQFQFFQPQPLLDNSFIALDNMKGKKYKQLNLL